MEAHRKCPGGDLHGEIVVVGAPDTTAHHQSSGSDAAERSQCLGAAPQQGQRHRDQAGAQHTEQREHAFDRVGDLESDNGIGAEAQATQASGDRGNHAIGMRIGEAARISASEARAIGRIEQGERVRSLQRGLTQQVVEGHVGTDTRADHPAALVVEDHGRGLV